MNQTWGLCSNGTETAIALQTPYIFYFSSIFINGRKAPFSTSSGK